LVTTYPGNTTVVTSRIVGYENPHRFDETEFGHFRLTRLRLDEIRQFVADWYKVREHNERLRERNVKDLTGIFENPELRAIRELAENPLLLTIIALVHRIDGVLPDERVVLYRKCTETLLVSWWKGKLLDETRSGSRAERRNKQRVEAIAHWMHKRSVTGEQAERAVVPYRELHKFLKEYIAGNEPPDLNDEPEDVAEAFLEFIKKYAGLLVELGDGRYSFVHLTFQEYLTASFIRRESLIGGADKIWETIEAVCHDSRWHEVIRLLVAELESDTSQEFLVEKLLQHTSGGGRAAKARLLGGLLIDGVAGAESFTQEILEELFESALAAENVEELRPLNSLLGSWRAKESAHEQAVYDTLAALWPKTAGDERRLGLVLAAVAAGLPTEKILELTGDYLDTRHPSGQLFHLFFAEPADGKVALELPPHIDRLWAGQDLLPLHGMSGALLGAALLSVNSSFGRDIAVGRAFEALLASLSAWDVRDSFSCFTYCTAQIFLKGHN
ncbi:MAG TPA: hypothetical protein VGV38_03915, partial [Pyrinomonadaceae bacterium]|nr:hypothetical protein [Pyrinomonadaceae bacterium]